MPRDAEPASEPEQTDSLTTSEATDVPVPTQTTPHADEVNAHLANERTFLAWSFTSLFIMGGGVALARTLIALNTSPLSSGADGGIAVIFYPTTMGLMFLTAGLVIMILAACRYMSAQEQIIERRYRPSSKWVLGYLAIILFLCAILAGFLLQLRGTL